MSCLNITRKNLNQAFIPKNLTLTLKGKIWCQLMFCRYIQYEYSVTFADVFIKKFSHYVDQICSSEGIAFLSKYVCWCKSVIYECCFWGLPKEKETVYKVSSLSVVFRSLILTVNLLILYLGIYDLMCIWERSLRFVPVLHSLTITFNLFVFFNDSDLNQQVKEKVKTDSIKQE